MVSLLLRQDKKFLLSVKTPPAYLLDRENDLEGLWFLSRDKDLSLFLSLERDLHTEGTRELTKATWILQRPLLTRGSNHWQVWKAVLGCGVLRDQILIITIHKVQNWVLQSMKTNLSWSYLPTVQLLTFTISNGCQHTCFGCGWSSSFVEIWWGGGVTGCQKQSIIHWWPIDTKPIRPTNYLYSPEVNPTVPTENWPSVGTKL